MAWEYDYKCTTCSEKYSVAFDTVRIGPFGMFQILGPIDENAQSDTIIHFESKPLYDGDVVEVKCPLCRFTCLICLNLDSHALEFFLKHAQTKWSQYDLSKYFTSGRIAFKGFPINCLNCDGEITHSGQFKKCKFCGSSKLAVLGSRSASPHEG